ncbi:MAG: hypothetical protein MR295_07980, partial [Ruminococcus bromii]|nr:hypothetical protein [Ruminococcus bromii]
PAATASLPRRCWTRRDNLKRGSRMGRAPVRLFCVKKFWGLTFLKIGASMNKRQTGTDKDVQPHHLSSESSCHRLKALRRARQENRL